MRRVLLLSLLLAGCGTTPQAVPVAATGPVINGVARKFGVDVARYRQLAARAHPAHWRTSRRPPAADDRAWCGPVYDQGNLSSCTAFAMGKGLREYMQRKAGQAPTPLSALWFYYRERVHMGPQYVAHDAGANLVDGMYVLEHEGAAPDALWPYKIRNFAVAPPAEADAAAASQKVLKTRQLATFEDVRAAIADGHPVAFGFIVMENIHRVGPDGVMPMPQAGDSVLGGHAVLAVGYDDAKQLLTVRNSWGPEWADHGYFYMPYAYVTDPAYVMDFWTAE
jgi:C1A family cysteine protease